MNEMELMAKSIFDSGRTFTIRQEIPPIEEECQKCHGSEMMLATRQQAYDFVRKNICQSALLSDETKLFLAKEEILRWKRTGLIACDCKEI